MDKLKNEDIIFAEKLKNHEPTAENDWQGWDDFDEFNDDAKLKRR